MNLQAPTTLTDFMHLVEAQWGVGALAVPGWIEQTDEDDGYRVLVAVAMDAEFQGRHLRVFQSTDVGASSQPDLLCLHFKGNRWWLQPNRPLHIEPSALGHVARMVL